MVIVLVTYDELPDPDRYAEHAALCDAVPGGEFAHGPVFGSPMGDPAFAYMAEWRFPDMERSRRPRGLRSSPPPARTRPRWGSRFGCTSAT